MICLSGNSHKGLLDSFLKDFFINSLKEENIAHVIMQHPKTWLEACDGAREVEMVMHFQNKRPYFPTYTMPLMEPTSSISIPSPLRIQKLSPNEM